MAEKGLVVMFIYLHLVQKISKTKILKRENCCFKNFFFIKNLMNLVNFTRNLERVCSEILHKMPFTKLWVEEFKGSHFECFCQKFDKGNSVQIQPHFPAKKLSL